MKISLLTIGDEVTSGLILNTNSQWLASRITAAGGIVTRHSSVADDESAIIEELKIHLAASDIAIMTGGLGPTGDDITKATLCKYFDDSLILHEATHAKLVEFFAKRNLSLIASNESQAYVPSKCEVIPNSVGSAPGMLFRKDGKFLFSLPGIPAEMEAITNEHIIPFLQREIAARGDEISMYKILQTSGIPESFLAELLNDIKFDSGATLAYLPSLRGVRLRIKSTATSINRAKEIINKAKSKIYAKAGKYIFAEDDVSLAERVAEMLSEAKLTISVAESCTGGMLGSTLTDISGAGEYLEGGIISYSNEIKINRLGVEKEIIEKFGAVSPECAYDMALKCRKLFNTDIALSITGLAGPTGGTPQKPVGLVYFGIADKDDILVEKQLFSPTSRQFIRERSVAFALNMIMKRINGTDK